MTSYQQQQLHSIESYERIFLFGEIERFGEEAVVDYFKICPVVQVEELRNS